MQIPCVRLSGMVAADDFRHQVQSDRASLIAPIQVPIPGGKFVNQYAPTVVGGENVYDPAGDCDGYFMGSKFQKNNNCYNYACDIATNSFAQPGRKHGHLLTGGELTGERVSRGAQLDGLLPISRFPMNSEELRAKQKQLPPGHFVALLMSEADTNKGWPGDYHWVRCDESGTWSQKDGTDQVTNFDYAGNAIIDPAKANWTVNEGPLMPGNPAAVVVDYKFHSIMYVPDGQVDII